MEWLTRFLPNSTGGVLLALLFCVLASAVGFVLVSVLIVKLPADYFRQDEPPRDDAHPVVYWANRVLKNVAGVVAVIVGILLSLPGIPGPGLVLVVIGLTLVDFPGKRRLQRKLLGRPKVLGAINRLRKRFGKAPLSLPPKPAAPDR